MDSQKKKKKKPNTRPPIHQMVKQKLKSET